MHDTLILNTLLAPEALYHLLSPQNWEQQSRDPDGKYCMIKHNKMMLYWEGGKFSKQIILDKDNNCGYIRTLLSYKKYNKFAIALNSQMQSNNECQDIEKPKAYKEEQVNNGIESVAPFFFERT